MRLARLFLQRFEQEPEGESRPEIVPLRSAQWAPGSRFQPIDLQPICAQPSSLKAWSEMEALMERYWPGVRMARDHWKRSGGKFTLWRDAPLMISGARFRVPTLEGHARPLLITGGVPQLQVPVGANCRALHILGNVTMPDGYPIAVNKGAVWGVFRVRYTSGKSHEIPLRHGFEVARANMIHRASRIDPMALEAPRALRYTKDPAREHLQALLFSAALDGGTVAEIGWQINPGESPLAIFAVTAELR